MDDSVPAPGKASTFADKIFGVNLFGQDDARHTLWETNARYAAEELSRAQSEMLRNMPPEAAPPEEFLAYKLNFASRVFDIRAKRLLIFIAKTPGGVTLYQECLARMVESQLMFVIKRVSGSSKAELLSELKIRLKQRQTHWTAEALRLARETDSGPHQDEDFNTGASKMSKRTSRTSNVPLKSASRISNAPRPPSPVGGISIRPSSSSKRTRVPPLDWKIGYPAEIQPQTELIICESVQQFQVQTQTAELCRYVVARVTPHFYAAVREGKLKAHTITGHVEDLVRSLVVYNSDYSRDGNRLESEVRNSEEWLKFTKEVEAARAMVHVAEGDPIEKKTLSTGQASRKGYRSEVRTWMTRKNLTTVGQACNRLGVSESTLKSIMSNKGRKRYGADVLKRVLAEVIPTSPRSSAS